MADTGCEIRATKIGQRPTDPGLGAANNFSYNSLWVEIYGAQ